MKQQYTRWAIQWREKVKGGPFMCTTAGPLLFKTRRSARAEIARRWGYIARRPDLRRAPCNWRMPAPVRVRVTVEAVA